MPGLSALEDEMARMTMTGYQGRGSPDRVDALVWALTDGMIVPARAVARPGLRQI